MPTGAPAKAPAAIGGPRSSLINFKFGSIAQGGHGAAYLTAYQSRDALASYFDGLTRDWEMIEYTTDHFIAQDDRVVMIGHCTWRQQAHRQGGVDAEGGFLALCGRKVVEFYEFYDTAQLASVQATV